MKVLIVVDMQNDFIFGSLGSEAAQAILPNVVKKVQEYENSQSLVIFTLDTHTEDYFNTLEGKNLPILHCIKDSKGWELAEDITTFFKSSSCIKYSSGEINDNKLLKSTFGSYDLINALYTLELEQNEKIEEIELCGLVSNICLVSNAIMTKMAFPEILITVDSTCCAGTSLEEHEAALKIMRSCQINVI